MGSEMCIRDRISATSHGMQYRQKRSLAPRVWRQAPPRLFQSHARSRDGERNIYLLLYLRTENGHCQRENWTQDPNHEYHRSYFTRERDGHIRPSGQLGCEIPLDLKYRAGDLVDILAFTHAVVMQHRYSCILELLALPNTPFNTHLADLSIVFTLQYLNG